MRSAVLRQFDHVMLDSVDVLGGKVFVQPGPRHRHADGKRKMQRSRFFNRLPSQSPRMFGKSQRPQCIRQKAKSIPPAVVTDGFSLRESRLFCIGVERALKME